MADPDIQIRGAGHPDPEITGGGGGLKKVFRPFGPQFGLKIRGNLPIDVALEQRRILLITKGEGTGKICFP